MKIDILTSHIGLSVKSIQVHLVRFGHGDVVRGRRGPVAAVAGPGHPTQRSLDGAEVADARVEVGHEVDVPAGGGLHLGDVDAVAGERRDEDLVVDHELGGPAGVLGDLLADGGGLVDAPPVEVERDEHLHVVVCSRLVREVELRVGVWVDADVQRKRVDAVCLCALHVLVVVRGAVAVAANADLVDGQRSRWLWGWSRLAMK